MHSAIALRYHVLAPLTLENHPCGAHCLWHYAACVMLAVQVVMISILGFGAFTKPLLAAMLKGDAEAAALAAQLSKIPLLG